jgi:syntaxin 16
MASPTPLFLPRTRDLTNKFIWFREQVRSRPAVPTATAAQPSPLDEFKDSAPAYSGFIQQIQADYKQIKALLKQLALMHEERLKVSFTVDDSERDQKVQVLTDQISGLFSHSENNLRKIAIVGNGPNDPELPVEERKIRLNVMKRLAMEMQLLLKQFRSTQEKYITRVKGLSTLGSDIVPTETSESGEGISMDKLSPAALQQLDTLEQQGKLRHEDILKLTRTINDLAQLFNQLNLLVVEQGTVLDRIDKNLEMTLTRAQEGNKTLKKAEKTSRAPKMLICIALLLIMAVILLIIVINKYSSSSSTTSTSSSSSTGN